MSIKLVNIAKSYSKDSHVLNNLSFEISNNEYVALIGNNGSGKTTTLKIINNLITYTGQVFINEKLIQKKDYKFRASFGFILDASVLIENFTIYEYCSFLNKIYNITDFELKLHELSNLLDIKGLLQTNIGKLSSGERMKILIISSLLHNPDTLIFDEPFINLDINSINKITAILNTLKNKKTLFISSHNLDLVADLCDRFLIMDKGKIALDINKLDYDNVEDMKKHIKKIVAVDNDKVELKWLS